MSVVVGLGEAMLRLSAPGNERLEQADELHVEVGGAELNALIAATAWGARGRWLTRLADNPLGRRAAAHARAHGVEPEVQWDAEARAALYFVEHGAPPRPTQVLYDRGDSAMARLDADGFDWALEVESASAALTSGITLGIGPGPAEAARALLAAARSRGVRTFFDVNHRSRQWTWEEAAPVVRGVLGDVDVLLAGAHDLERLLERDGEPVGLAQEAIARFGHEAVMLRENVHAGERVMVTVTAVTPAEVVGGRAHSARVIDGFGGGDAALGALVARLLAGDSIGTAADHAARACAVQHTITGDAWIGRPDELALNAERSILR
ncbi:PfkB family carbohydrate kinase [Candidatus Solirubrobacter pratensis]|uniref:PfkB family carbohydrate kinase n=1 Tax=Candidatus Solirubrobacter pratensis TaxID=1298857 RepID=UPI0004246A18|nr:PfkB family carbohydrate kinase [Candidatus Solirubrobacter pratensis]